MEAVARVTQLEAMVERLGLAIEHLQDALHRKNVELDALHFVWCDGGCPGGVHRYEEMREVPLTEEIVLEAERNTKRLRRWLVNAASRSTNDEFYERLRASEAQS